MPTPEQADAISRLGAFAIFVFLTGFAGVALWRRWIVLGWFYDEERKARIVAETQATRNAEALEANNVVLAEQSKTMAATLTAVTGIRRDMRALRDDLARQRRNGG